MNINRTHRLLIRIRPVLRFIKTRILHTDDSPERIARGIAVGLFTAWLPLFGLHIPLAILFGAIIRANKAMALLFIWVSNPLTALFIYYPGYRLGRLILSLFRNPPPIQPEQLQSMFAQILSLDRIFWELFTADFWKQLWDVFSNVGLEMLIGGILLGFVVAKISYWVSLRLIKRFRNRRLLRQSILTE